jgi:PST family polysaccharide transporter
MLRTKLVAVLLGPSGVGLVGLYQSVVDVVGTVTGLGLGQSAVRQIAEAASTNDQQRIGRAVFGLRRLCWITGLGGTLLTMVLAWPLSLWTFGNGDHAFVIASLGVTLLFTSISNGQMALIRGSRRIGDIARSQVLAIVIASLISVGFYAWLGQRAIALVLILSAAAKLGFSWQFARRVPVPHAEMTWSATLAEARGAVSLGLAFMWAGLLAAVVTLATRSMILRQFGVEANGLFQAAWGISGVFAGFILNAMGADFYPRLTAAANDNREVNRLVNEQTEVGILLALPGLLGTLVFSPWVIRIFYSANFREAAVLLPWFILGLFGRVISWPLSYIQLAKGAARWFGLTETGFSVLHLGLVWAGLRGLGLTGAAVAFAVLYVVYTLALLWMTAHLSGFRWSKSVVRLLSVAAVVVLGAFALIKFAPEGPAMILGGVGVLASFASCTRQLCGRLGPRHRLSRFVASLPVLGRMITP